MTLDKSWTIKNVLSYFLSKDDDEFNSCWQGFAAKSGFQKEIISTIYETLLYLSKNIKRITDTRTITILVDLIVLTSIDLIEDPLYELIPNFFKYSYDYTDKFYDSLLNKIRERNKDEKNHIWENWLKDLITNRLKNIPVKYCSEETDKILLILLEYSYLKNDVNSIIKLMNIENCDVNNVIYNISTKSINENNFEGIQLLLIFCLKCIYNDKEKMIDVFLKEYVIDTILAIKNENYKIINDLKEICSLMNIQLD